MERNEWMDGRAKHSPIHQWAQHHFIAIKRRVSQSVNIMFSFVCAWAYCAYGCVRWVKWSDKCTHLVIHMTQTMVIIVFLLLLLLLVLVVSPPSSHEPMCIPIIPFHFRGISFFLNRLLYHRLNYMIADQSHIANEGEAEAEDGNRSEKETERGEKIHEHQF